MGILVEGRLKNGRGLCAGENERGGSCTGAKESRKEVISFAGAQDRGGAGVGDIHEKGWFHMGIPLRRIL